MDARLRPIRAGRTGGDAVRLGPGGDGRARAGYHRVAVVGTCHRRAIDPESDLRLSCWRGRGKVPRRRVLEVHRCYDRVEDAARDLRHGAPHLLMHCCRGTAIHSSPSRITRHRYKRTREP